MTGDFDAVYRFGADATEVDRTLDHIDQRIERSNQKLEKLGSSSGRQANVLDDPRRSLGISAEQLRQYQQIIAAQKAQAAVTRTETAEINKQAAEARRLRAEMQTNTVATKANTAAAREGAAAARQSAAEHQRDAAAIRTKTAEHLRDAAAIRQQSEATRAATAESNRSAAATREQGAALRLEVQQRREAERLARQHSEATQGLTRSFGALRTLVGSLGQGLQSLGRTLSVAVTAPLILLAGYVVNAAVRMESLKLGLRAVAGSAEEADKQLARLTEVAKLPGIGFEEAIQGSIRLQAVGFRALDAERALKAFANAIALTGGGKAELAAVTVQLAQLVGKSKILAQDLRPIIEASPAVAAALKKAFGTVDSEQISKLVSGPGEFLRKLIPALEALPHVAGGAKTAFENLQDSLFRLGAAIGTAVLPPLVALADRAIPLVERAAAAFQRLSPEMQQVVIGAVALAAVLGLLLFVVGSIVVSVVGFVAALITLKAAFVAIAAVGGSFFAVLLPLLPLLALVVTAIGLVAGAIYLAKDRITGAWGAIVETFNRAGEAIQAFARGDWERGIQLLVEVAARAYGILQRVLFEITSEALERAWAAIRSYAVSIANAAKNLAEHAVAAFSASITNLPAVMGAAILSILVELASAPGRLARAAYDMGKSVAVSVLNGFNAGYSLKGSTAPPAPSGARELSRLPRDVAAPPSAPANSLAFDFPGGPSGAGKVKKEADAAASAVRELRKEVAGLNAELGGDPSRVAAIVEYYTKLKAGATDIQRSYEGLSALVTKFNAELNTSSTPAQRQLAAIDAERDAILEQYRAKSGAAKHAADYEMLLDQKIAAQKAKIIAEAGAYQERVEQETAAIALGAAGAVNEVLEKRAAIEAEYQKNVVEFQKNYLNAGKGAEDALARKNAQLAALDRDVAQQKLEIENAITAQVARNDEDRHEAKLAQIQAEYDKRRELIAQDVGDQAFADAQAARVRDAAIEGENRRYAVVLGTIRLRKEEIDALAILDEREQLAAERQIAVDRARLDAMRQGYSLELQDNAAREAGLAIDQQRLQVAARALRDRFAATFDKQIVSSEDFAALSEAATLMRDFNLTLDDIAANFGYIATSIQAVRDQLKALATGNQVPFWQQLSGGLKQVAKDFFASAKAGEYWGGIIENVFQQVGSGAATLGQALKSALLGAAADMASAFASVLREIAVGYFLAGDWVRGSLLVAASFALNALAGYLRGISQASSQVAAPAGSGGGGGASAPASAPRERPIERVRVNTSGESPFSRSLPFVPSASQPQTIIIEIGGGGPKAKFYDDIFDEVEERGAVTVRGLNGEQRVIVRKKLGGVA